MKADELLALAERVQALTGPCQAADEAIRRALDISFRAYWTGSLDAAEMLVRRKGWHWRKLTGTSVSVYRQDPAKTATARFDGYGHNDACRMTAAYLLALADSVAIAEKAAARKVDA